MSLITTSAQLNSIPPKLQLDLQELQQQNYTIEICGDGSNYGIIFKNFEIENRSWNRDKTDVLVIAHPTYPNAKLDMFFVPEGLRLKNGVMPKAGDTIEIHCGLKWQRFSWHLKIWNPAFDNIISYLEVIRERFNKPE